MTRISGLQSELATLVRIYSLSGIQICADNFKNLFRSDAVTLPVPMNG